MTSSIESNNIIYGGEITSKITSTYRSLGHFLLEQIKKDGDFVMMTDASTGNQYTRKYIHDRIIRLAYILQKLGVKDGDVIGICGENSIDYAVVLYAAFALGATAAPFNATYSERELEHATNLSKPKVLFCSRSPFNKILGVAKKNKYIQHVIVFGDVSPSSEATALEELIKGKKFVSYPDFEAPAVNKCENVALIVCSSGTTGMPKGVQLTQMNILNTLDAQFEPEAISFSDIAVLSVIPWFHAFGCITLVLTSCMNTNMVFLPKFEERVFLGAIQKYKVVLAFMVPPLMVFLAKHPIVDKYDLSSLLVLVCGAAPLSKETVDTIKARIGVPIIRQGYGLSESTLAVLVQSDTHCKPGSVGILKRGIYAKVLDTDSGAILGPNQRGELCFKGECIMKGYVGDKKSTQTIIKDGWLHTGDIGYFDDDFEFFIVDRIKELIKYKAFQVPPAEIEALLLTNPKIKDAAVIGKPDEECGELPMAFVVKQPNAQLTEDEVVKFVADNASPAKKLRGGVRFIDEIPKNPSGKILRRVLRDMLVKPKSKL
ncbi:uncharacterized protein LOC129939373 [Eupeodes corollae]|uniref:uncharacterized protein LOC129939373 n=1 Tax=Eupeodes corollae TaxID=290404 RepID=UPI002492BF34|nr:uncharacterized protein LOC129939373 [Eupeodes corollae]XP_055903337.1 uncharacterized protein LOC129939373 [Eupeodes corollae]